MERKERFDMPDVDLKIFIMKILECKNQMSSLTFKYAAKENDDFKLSITSRDIFKVFLWLMIQK